MSGRAAGKLKQKKDGRPKNVLGAHFFPLLQMYLFHPFLLLINSLPPSLATPLNPQNSAFISLRPGRPLPYHPPRKPVWVSGGAADPSVFICLLPPRSLLCLLLRVVTSAVLSAWSLGFTDSAVHVPHQKNIQRKMLVTYGYCGIMGVGWWHVLCDDRLNSKGKCLFCCCCCCCYKKKVMSVYITSDHLSVWQW